MTEAPGKASSPVTRRNPVKEWLRALGREMLGAPEVNHDGQSAWYAGLVIDPTAFTEQLGQLKSSLNRANAPANPSSPRSAHQPEEVRSGVGRVSS